MRIFHTSDVHIGLKFMRGYSDEVRGRLVDARIETLQRMVDLANDEHCDLFVISGDLFENMQVSKGRIRETAAALSRFDRLVVVLPGNHDYIQEQDDPIWPTFCDALGAGHLVLGECRPYSLRESGLDAILYPAPCTSRHSKNNAIGWIGDALQGNLDSESERPFRIGVAHGSLEGLSPDFSGDYYPMTRAELDATNLDLWLLGHTHVRFPDKGNSSVDRVFFPSVPEPDGFDCRHPGYAWVIELAENGSVSARSVETGQYRFTDLAVPLSGPEDLESLRNRFQDFSPERDLVRLRLSGRIAGAKFDSIGELFDQLSTSVLHLQSDLGELLREVSRNDIDKEFTEGSFPHRLLCGLEGEDEEGALALQIAYELVREAKS